MKLSLVRILCLVLEDEIFLFGRVKIMLLCSDKVYCHLRLSDTAVCRSADLRGSTVTVDQRTSHVNHGLVFPNLRGCFSSILAGELV